MSGAVLVLAVVIGLPLAWMLVATLGGGGDPRRDLVRFRAALDRTEPGAGEAGWIGGRRLRAALRAGVLVVTVSLERELPEGPLVPASPSYLVSGFTLRVVEGAVEAALHARHGLEAATMREALEDLIARVEEAEALRGAAPVSPPIEAEAGPEIALAPRVGARCPYCRETLGEDEAWGCPECGTPQHEACWEELGGCSTHGCAAAPRPGQREGV
ncbi:MAG: RING finger protein [Planctomycetota bacterium]